MKTNWHTKKLGEICDIQTGKWDASHATPKGKYRFYTCAYEHMFCGTKRFSGECLILPGNGVNVGEIFYHNGDFDAYQRTYVINNIRIFPKFLYYHLLCFWKVRNLNKQFGSATNFLKIGNFLDYEVYYPESLSEQKRIVKILDEAFEKIEKAKENAERNLKNSKELFESYLNNIFTKPGKDWSNFKLYELSKSKNAIVSGPFGSNLKVSDYKESGIPILRLQNIGKGYFIDKDIKHISNNKAEELKYHSFISGDVVLAKLGIPIGKTCIVPNNFKSGIIVADVVRIRLDKNIVDYKFIEYFLNTDISVKQLTGNISGATRPRVNLSDVRNINISIPNLDKQKNVVKKLNELSKQTKKLEEVYQKKLADLEELKKSVLNKAFTGEL